MSDIEFLESVLKIVFYVAATIAVPLVLKWIRERQDEWRLEEWYIRIKEIIAEAVATAEQLGLDEQLEDYADTKMKYVLKALQEQLNLLGIPINVEDYLTAIISMIEAEVKDKYPKNPQEYVLSVADWDFTAPVPADED